MTRSPPPRWACPIFPLPERLLLAFCRFRSSPLAPVLTTPDEARSAPKASPPPFPRTPSHYEAGGWRASSAVESPPGAAERRPARTAFPRRRGSPPPPLANKPWPSPPLLDKTSPRKILLGQVFQNSRRRSRNSLFPWRGSNEVPVRASEPPRPAPPR